MNKLFERWLEGTYPSYGQRRWDTIMDEFYEVKDLKKLKHWLERAYIAGLKIQSKDGVMYEYIAKYLEEEYDRTLEEGGHDEQFWLNICDHLSDAVEAYEGGAK